MARRAAGATTLAAVLIILDAIMLVCCLLVGCLWLACCLLLVKGFFPLLCVCALASQESLGFYAPPKHQTSVTLWSTMVTPKTQLRSEIQQQWYNILYEREKAFRFVRQPTKDKIPQDHRSKIPRIQPGTLAIKSQQFLRGQSTNTKQRKEAFDKQQAASSKQATSNQPTNNKQA